MANDISSDPLAVTVIEALLQSFRALRTLTVETNEHRLIGARCIARHAATLTCLISTSSRTHPRKYYSLTDMRIILDSCRELTQVGLHFGPIHLGRAERLGLQINLLEKCSDIF